MKTPRSAWIVRATVVIAGWATVASAEPPVAPRKPLNSKESAELREQARAKLASNELDEVGRLLDRARGVIAPTERAAWWLIEAEYFDQRGNPGASALSAMRIVLSYPKSEHAGSALYWAARAYEKIGRRDKAIELYRECAAHRRLPPALRETVKATLSRLEHPPRKT